MQKTNILHVTFDMPIAGTEQVIYNLIAHSDPNRYHHSLCCIEAPVGAIGEKLKALGYVLYSFQRRPGFDRQLIRDIRKVLKEAQIDIVHCHQYSPYVYGLFASLGLGKKVIFTEHGRLYPDTSSWKRRRINPLMQYVTDQITCISKATIEALVQVENFSRKKVALLYNGVTPVESDVQANIDIRERFGIPLDAIVFGTVSRLDPIKNQAMMLNAFKQVHKRQPNSYLVFVGDGSERPKLESQAQDLGVRTHTIFAGFQVAPQAYFNAIDIFLLSSFSEGTSMTLLEAMSCGLPSVATRVGGNSEVLEDGLTGMLTPNDDADAFASAMQAFVESLELRQKIGRQAAETFKERFDVRVMVEQYHALYRRLLAP